MYRPAHKAIGLFKIMVNKGFTSDDITFVGVLSACSHAGLINLGQQYFHSVVPDYKIPPKLQHHGKCDDVARIRTKFKDNMSKKIPGCTSIEVDGILHEFLASDKTHLMSDKIYAMLEAINRLLDEFGHIYDNYLVLYDMEDELKEGVFSQQHSERLAIVFELGTMIRIMKNAYEMAD